MAQLSSARLGNPRTGLYFGIYASLVIGAVLLAILLEQLGVSEGVLGLVMFAVPIGLYAAFGIAVRASDPFDFFAAGRRVPAVVVGSVTAISALGGVGLVSLTGALFLMGSDAFALLLGFPAGLVVMGVLLAPYLRKFGAYTIAGYLAARLDSRVLLVAAAATMAAPVLLVLVAELRLAGWLAGRMTGLSPQVMSLACAGLLAMMLVGGGVRSLTWSSTAKVVGVILALVVPVTIAAVMVSNVPLPQLTAGNVSRNILRLELARGVPLLQASPWLVDVPGAELEALGRRFLQMFGSVGSSAYSLVTLAVLAGVASSPALLLRPLQTRSVLETRAAMAWAVITAAFVILTMTAVAVYLRAYVTEQVFGSAADRLPGWFQVLQNMGLGQVGAKGSVPVSMAAIAFNRDGVIAALPVAMGLPAVFMLLALAGAVAACLAAAAAQMTALGTSISEDILLGGEGHLVAPTTQLWLGRSAIVGVAAVGGALSLVQADPLQLVLWALTLSASAVFPVLVLSVLWKRLTAWGAVVGMLTGFAGATALILMDQLGQIAWAAPLPVIFALPAGALAAIALSFVTPAISRPTYELLRDMRVPGGETLTDRHRRLERMKRSDPG